MRGVGLVRAVHQPGYDDVDGVIVGDDVDGGDVVGDDDDFKKLKPVEITCY